MNENCKVVLRVSDRVFYFKSQRQLIKQVFSSSFVLLFPILEKHTEKKE